MKRERLAFVVRLTYVWALLTLFGGLLFETLIIYPNIFHDVPHSLETAKAFAVVRGPSDFFPPLGALVVASGIGSVLLGWRVRAARLWLLSGLIALVLGDFLTSVLFQWPRNSIVRRGHRRPFRRLPAADRPGVPRVPLAAAGGHRHGTGAGVHRVPAALPTPAHLPAAGPAGTGGNAGRGAGLVGRLRRSGRASARCGDGCFTGFL
jgi:hypothetical protein